MKKNKILASLFLVIFVAGFASAFWPFDGNVMTGNAVRDNIFINDSNFNNCQDSDSGIYSNVSGVVSASNLIGRSKDYVDTCSSKGTFVKEWYCKNGKKTSKKIKCKSGCDDGACRSESVCTVTADGVQNTFGKELKNKCSRKSWIQYGCNNGTVAKEAISCSTKCSNSEGGCVGVCTNDTDVGNSATVAGSVLIDGSAQVDICVGNSVKQFACNGDKVQQIKPQKCGDNRKCVDDPILGAKCVNRFAGADLTGTVGDLGGIITDLSGQVSALGSDGGIRKERLSDSASAGMTVVMTVDGETYDVSILEVLDDSSAYLNFGGNNHTVEVGESLEIEEWVYFTLTSVDYQESDDDSASFSITRINKESLLLRVIRSMISSS